MENGTITLRCVRSDGRRESTRLEHLSLPEAHNVAERVLKNFNEVKQNGSEY